MANVTSIPRVLIADDERMFARRLCEFLKERGFSCRFTDNGFEATDLIKDWKPQFILYDMMLPEMNALTLLEKIKNQSVKLPKDCMFMVTSGHNISTNVRACIHAGATDFIIRPCSFEDILSRMIFHSQKRKNLRDADNSLPPDNKSDQYLYLTEMTLRKTILGATKTGDLIYDLLQMQALAVKAIRCSLIRTDHERMTGLVVSSSDDKNFKGFELNLNKYPEITAVLHTEKLVAIDNLSGNTTMAKVQSQFQDISFNAMAVCPVWLGDQIFGVISTRLSLDAPPLTDADIRFAQILAHSIGLILQKDRQEKLLTAA